MPLSLMNLFRRIDVGLKMAGSGRRVRCDEYGNHVTVLAIPNEGPCGDPRMLTLHLQIVPILSIAAGILILVMPKILNYVVAGYLIVIGVLGLIK
jgi:hypothetical protein